MQLFKNLKFNYFFKNLMEINRKDADGFGKGPLDNILTHYEVEMIVENIKPIDLKDYGSEK